MQLEQMRRKRITIAMTRLMRKVVMLQTTSLSLREQVTYMYSCAAEVLLG